MRIVFLTTNDPIYLPLFFERVLNQCGRHTLAVYATPPLYKGQTTLQAARKVFRTFGIDGMAGLISRTLLAKMRGQSIATVCKERSIAYMVIEDVNAPDFIEKLQREGVDLIVSVSCPQIFKKPLIDLPALGCLNIHGAILPHYRGVMPSFWMLANGEKRAGVSIFRVNEKIDAGELCGQRIFEVLPDESLHEFIRRSKVVAADLLLEVLQQFQEGTVSITPLNLTEGSYYSWPNADAVRRFRAAGRRLW
jgi:methionyl-tRNA formyltransferase